MRFDKPNDGDVIVVENYPFVLERYDREEDYSEPIPEFDYVPSLGWRPGTRTEFLFADEGGDHTRRVYDGFGKQFLTVVSTHRPGKFPTRVFYTRKWADPDGKEFGNGRCRITTLGRFNQLRAGYHAVDYLDIPVLSDKIQKAEEARQ